MRLIESPSIFGSVTYATSLVPSRLHTSWCHFSSASSVVTFSSEPIGEGCATFWNLSDGGAPTRCVGEPGVTSFGSACSSATSSSTQRVGAPPSDKFQKVAHPSPMGSLEKVTTEEALEKWHQDVCKRLGTSDVAYVTEPKIDGLSINLTYENGVFVRG